MHLPTVCSVYFAISTIIQYRIILDESDVLYLKNLLLFFTPFPDSKHLFWCQLAVWWSLLCGITVCIEMYAFFLKEIKSLFKKLVVFSINISPLCFSFCSGVQAPWFSYAGGHVGCWCRSTPAAPEKMARAQRAIRPWVSPIHLAWNQI